MKQLRRRQHTGPGAVLERAYLDIITAVWLGRTLWRGWRIAR